MKTKNLLRGAIVACALTLAMLGSGARALAAINVVATLPELGAITREVGGNHVSVYVVARPNRDYHQIDPRPSDVSRVAQAKLVVRTGMQFELWMDSLANATGNTGLTNGGANVVNASAGIRRLDVPSSQISGASGDIHVDGNPHYFYDPIYGKFIARNILRGLLRVDPKNASDYRANYSRFNAGIDRRMVGWRAVLAPFAGRSVVTYHENYAYFFRRFGLKEYGHLEPKPGIPPSAGHIDALIQNMKRDNVKAVVIESIYSTRYADLIARQTGARVVGAPYSVSGMGAGSYFELIDKIESSFRQALS